jgi:hypothetical protein
MSWEGLNEGGLDEGGLDDGNLPGFAHRSVDYRAVTIKGKYYHIHFAIL